jgi:hypothetical protein
MIGGRFQRTPDSLGVGRLIFQQQELYGFGFHYE